MAKKLALIFGVIFVLVGILGFIPNSLVGAGAVFATNTMHDVVHLLLGLILLVVAFAAPTHSTLWLKILGVVYLLVAALGFVMTSPLLGLVEVNAADNWLHVALAILLILAGGWAKDEMMEQPSEMSMQGMQSPKM